MVSELLGYRHNRKPAEAICVSHGVASNPARLHGWSARRDLNPCCRAPSVYIRSTAFFDICRHRRRWDGVRSFDRQPSERELMQIAATQRRGPCWRRRRIDIRRRRGWTTAAPLSEHAPVFHHRCLADRPHSVRGDWTCARRGGGGGHCS